jgi:hypothetical protein
VVSSTSDDLIDLHGLFTWMALPFALRMKDKILFAGANPFKINSTPLWKLLF